MGQKQQKPSKLENYNDTKNLKLDKFQQAAFRKMTCHILSNKAEECIKFIEFFTNEKLNNSKELKEINIKKKINLYSFMNYKAYDNASELINQIKDRIEKVKSNLQSKDAIYSEVIIILENENIKEHLDKIRNVFKNEIKKIYYIPFLLIISPNKIIDLDGFDLSKTFHYKFTLQNLYTYFCTFLNKKEANENNESKKEKEENKNENKKNGKKKKKIKRKNIKELKESKEIMEFIRKLNVLFSYYNELGDEFSFINSEGKEELIKIENDTDITVYMNIILMGESGSGKSTLLNLILGEKKSLEGGSGLSTTSKNIIVYKKAGIPLRFYDMKGMENDKTANNYTNILKDFNGFNETNIDYINAVFYCIQFTKGTVLKQMADELFQELVKLNIPIIFIITFSQFDPNEKCEDPEQKDEREEVISTILNAIKSKIKQIFKDKERENESEEFIKKYVKFEFVNLVARKDVKIPVFGIDKVLSILKDSIPKEDLQEIIYACLDANEEKYQKYTKKIPFLRNYSEIAISERNKKEAKEYLKKLKASAFFSGMVPGFDIGMEYFYKYQFKKKLKSLYGFDFYKAKEKVQDNGNFNLIKNEKEDNQEKEILLDINETDLIDSIQTPLSGSGFTEEEEYKSINEEELDIKIDNIKKEENEIESKISNTTNNAAKNVTSFLRGLGEAGSVVLKALPTAGRITLETGEVIVRSGISVGIKVASWVFLPVTCIGFGLWSLSKIHRDCEEIMEIFDKAFSPLKFETIMAYIQSFLIAIEYLDLKGKELIRDNKSR